MVTSATVKVRDVQPVLAEADTSVSAYVIKFDGSRTSAGFVALAAWKFPEGSMGDQTKSDRRSRTGMISDRGNSVLNRLPVISRRRLKRKADKTRRQQEKAELKKEIE